MMICNWATVARPLGGGHCDGSKHLVDAITELAFPIGVLIRDESEIDTVRATVLKECNPERHPWCWVRLESTECLTLNLEVNQHLRAVLVCREIDFFKED